MRGAIGSVPSPVSFEGTPARGDWSRPPRRIRRSVLGGGNIGSWPRPETEMPRTTAKAAMTAPRRPGRTPQLPARGFVLIPTSLRVDSMPPTSARHLPIGEVGPRVEPDFELLSVTSRCLFISEDQITPLPT